MSTRSKYQSGNLQFYDDKYHAEAPTGVWASCPLAAIAGDPSLAYVYDSNWCNYMGAEATGVVLAGYTVTSAASGAITMPDSAGGVLRLTAGTSAAAAGVQVQKITFDFLPAVGQPIWFETMVEVNALTAELFFGLASTDTSIISGSANSSTDHIGWQCVTDDGVLLFSAEKAGTGTTKASTTLVAATAIRLGFKVSNATATTLKIEHWVNDTKASTSHVNANVSVKPLSPSLVCQGGGGTTVPILRNYYTKCVQMR